jgi:L-ascorbate metabolism protein UlaG (beta-lactamase superfamily)
MNIRFLGHAAFALEHDGTTVLVDPFLTGNPQAAVAADEVAADAILLTHGHADHLGDTVAIAKRTGATVVAIIELAQEISADLGADHDVRDPNLGGTVEFDWGSVRLVPAWHTSTTPKGTASTPAGLVIEIGGKRIYHLGDTALFSDLELAGKRGRLDAALIPIGGHYTMDRFDAVEAARLIGADLVIPCHYDTFPAIETDAEAFKTDVQQAGFAQVAILEPGGTKTV